MFNPNDDKDAIYNILIADSVLMGLLGLTGATTTKIATQVIKRNEWEGLINNEKRLNIYFRPALKTYNDITTRPIVQIDCHVPAKEDYIAEKVMARVVYLLNDKHINKFRLYLYGYLGTLQTLSGFYCSGVRFYYYKVI